jgi:hypothetical protein
VIVANPYLCDNELQFFLTKTCAKIVLATHEVRSSTDVRSTPSVSLDMGETPILAHRQKIAHDDVKRGAGCSDMSRWAKRVDIAGFS